MRQHDTRSTSILNPIYRYKPGCFALFYLRRTLDDENQVKIILKLFWFQENTFLIFFVVMTIGPGSSLAFEDESALLFGLVSISFHIYLKHNINDPISVLKTNK